MQEGKKIEKGCEEEKLQLTKSADVFEERRVKKNKTEEVNVKNLCFKLSF